MTNWRIAATGRRTARSNGSGLAVLAPAAERNVRLRKDSCESMDPIHEQSERDRRWRDG